MLNFLVTYQVYILIGCGIMSLFLASFSYVINFRSLRKKRAMVKIEVGAAVLLISDALAYIYRGDVSGTGFLMTRISNFLVFSFTLLNIFFLNEYVVALFMETGRFEKLPKRLILGFVVPIIGVMGVIVSQFTGFYYSFNEQNLYVRGPLFMVSYIPPLLSLLFIFTFAIKYRNYVSRVLSWSVIIYGLLPLLAGVAQLWLYGLSLINLSSWLSGVVLFFLGLLAQNRELTRAANTEMGTGLPNALGYMEAVDDIINHGDCTKYSAFYFDIVRMSHYNNKYGKQKGDEIIITYAKNIRSRLDRDEILGRLGGNYFVALIKKVNVEKFLKLLSDVPVEIEYDGQLVTLHLAAIAGGYDIVNKNMVAGQILSNCASALTYAKTEAHKPYVFMDSALEIEFERVRELEEGVKKALVQGEFEPFYQPKTDCRTNKIVGAEAIARWIYNGEIVPTVDYISIMEKNGTICDLDFYILNRVCQDIENWIKQGIEPVQTSVNLSRKNLGNPILAEAISNEVDKYDIPKSLIQIEITETIDEFPMSYLVGVVDALHRYGLSAAIDDFGVGSSSISLLSQADFDVLKIDRTFIEYSDDREKQLLKDIIQMAGNIGIDVLAEGVETEEKVDELKKMGCYIIQGFVYDKALNKSDFEKRLINKQY